MKKRIIAALTALVMVVTMIPSAAFAATESVGSVRTAILKATTEGDANTKFAVPFDENTKADIDAAKAAYNSLTDYKAKEELAERADSKINSYDDLLAAEALYNYYGEITAEYNTALKGFREGVLVSTANDVRTTPEIKAIQAVRTKLMDAHTVDVVIANGVAKVVETATTPLVNDYDVKAELNKNAADGKTLLYVNALDNKATTALAQLEEIFGKAAALATTDKAYNDAVAAVNAITADDITAITADTKEGTASKHSRDKVTTADGFIGDAKSPITFGGKNVHEYIKYAKNYDNYVAAKAKVESFEVPKAVTEEIATANAGVSKTYGLATLEKVNTEYKAANYDAGWTTGQKLAPVNAANIKDVQKAYDKAVVVYNKYEANYADSVKTLKSNIDAVEKNIALYNEAKAIATRIDVLNEKAGIPSGVNKLTKAEAIEILNIDMDKKFMSTGGLVQKNPDVYALDRIDLFLADKAIKASERTYFAAYAALKAKANAVFAGESLTQIRADYARQFNDINNSLDILKVNANDVEALENALAVLNDYKLAITAAGGSTTITVTRTIDKAEDVYKAAALNDKAFFNDTYVKSADFEAFVEKCKVVAKDIDTAKTISTDFVKELDSASKASITDKAPKNYVATISNTTYKGFEAALDKATKAIKALDKAANADVKVAYELEQAKAVNKDADYINTLKPVVAKYVEANDALNDATAKAKADEVQKIIKENITIKSDKGAAKLTATEVARNKAAFEEISKLFAIKNVELYFRGLEGTTINPMYPERLYAKGSYTYGDEIIRYQTALEENVTIDASEAATSVISLIDALKYGTDADANLAAFNAAYDAYNKLSAADQAQVYNFVELKSYARNVAVDVASNIDSVMATVAPVVGTLSKTQLEICDKVDAMLKANENLLVFVGAYDAKAATNAMFNKAFFGAGATEYVKALNKINASKEAIAVKEEIAPVYKTLLAGTAKNASLTAIIDAIEAYEGLSDLAKSIALPVSPSGLNFAEIADVRTALNDTKLAAYAYADLKALIDNTKEYKSLVLDFAKVEPIEDQEFKGEAVVVPADKVVVKDFAGNIIPASKYDLSFSNNEKAGVATVTVTAKADADIIGMVTGTFNIVGGVALVAPTGLKVVASDNGILKIECDAVEGLQYKFFVRKIGNTKWSASKVKDTPTVTYTGLTKNAQYEVKAVTVLNGEESATSYMDGTVWTNRIGTRSAYMYKPAIKNVTIKNGVAKITVNKVNYNNVKYALGFKKAGASEFRWFAPNAKTVKTVKNLKKGVKYTFSVRYQYTSEVSNTTVKSAKWAKYVTKVAK